MKLCCILLISFALKNVFAPTFLRIDFKRQIILTNDYIYQAASKNKLHTVVKNIVCGPSSVEDVAIMLAVPELAHTRYLGQCINRETSIGTELNIVLLAQRFELETLGKIRRNQTKKAIKTLIISAIKLSVENAYLLVNYYRIISMYSGNEPDIDFPILCRFIALFRCTVYHSTELYTKKVTVDNNDTCTIITVRTVAKYKILENEIWQVNFINSQKIQKLSEELDIIIMDETVQ
ncbi:uncharacterized protein LOC126835601 isoform X2 [Adelges cooleyi]|uniref:uncharacterized protein LOC126835601 isoform X2 n=1 Tax=Adelges cooleyi TaxID=133065 RepID=UPI00217F71F9|nr:uncharacterized protein LOC126835601 isoform X2 [Adelges cooleyi]